jgi:hypothetical protein
LFIGEDNVSIGEDNVFIVEDNVFIVDKNLLMNEIRVLNFGKFCSSGGFHDLTSADEVTAPRKRVSSRDLTDQKPAKLAKVRSPRLQSRLQSGSSRGLRALSQLRWRRRSPAAWILERTTARPRDRGL